MFQNYHAHLVFKGIFLMVLNAWSNARPENMEKLLIIVKINKLINFFILNALFYKKKQKDVRFVIQIV
jgi:hypothetical protein